MLERAFGPSGEPGRAITFVGRFHPLAVHLPIGVILLVAVLEALALSPRLRLRIDPALPAVLSLALVSALVAFALGLMLAQSGGHPARPLLLHHRLALATVVASAGSLVAWSRHEARGGSRHVYRGAVLATVALLSLGAHFGGSMTHGEGYLVEYAPSFMRAREASARDEAKGDVVRASDPRVFDDVVLPILRRRCAGCHGADRSKGGLRTDSLEALLKGGKDGPAIAIGHSERSQLVRRVAMPLSADGHMPPEDRPQLTSAELELVRFWIDAGARADLEVRHLIVPDGARSLLVEAAGHAATAMPIEVATATATAKATAKADATATATATASTRTVAVAAAPPKPTAPMTLSPTGAEGAAPTFRGDVAPILANKCGRCHGAEKHNGGLRTDSVEALVAGGHSGPAIVPGDPARGALVARVRLPLDDDDHMPPQGEPQLDARELHTLASWIAREGVPSTRGDTVATRGRSELRATVAPAPPPASPGPPSPLTAQVPELADEPVPVPSPSAAGGATVGESTAAAANMIVPAPRGGCAGCAMARDDDDARAAGVAVLLLGALAVRRERARRRDVLPPPDAT